MTDFNFGTHQMPLNVQTIAKLFSSFMARLIIPLRKGVAMMVDAWRARVKRLLKAELKRRKVTYFELADKLAAIGIEEDEKNIAKKISRGAFKAIFLFQCLAAIGCEDLRLGSAPDLLDQRYIVSPGAVSRMRLTRAARVLSE